RSEQRAGEDAEEDGAPAEKRADAGEELQVAAPHGFARNVQLASHAADSVEAVERDPFVAEIHPVVMEPEIGRAEIALADDRFVAMQNELIGFAREVLAPQPLLFAHREIRVIAFARPGKWRRSIKLDSFLSENFFPGFEHDQEKDVTERGGQCRSEDGAPWTRRLHQFRNREAGDEA